jgi:hypothetical protein
MLHRQQNDLSEWLVAYVEAGKSGSRPSVKCRRSLFQKPDGATRAAA